MTAGSERIAWPDAARGIAIVLVVAHHSVQFTGSVGLAEPAWNLLSEGVRTMRMPLFFLAAGLFAGKWMRASWPDLLRSKVLLFAWVFVLWVVLRWAFFAAIPGTDEESGLLMLPLHLVWPIGGWFIFVLAVFFVVARATARIDPRIQLAVAAALSAVGFTGVVPIDNRAYEGMLLFYVFFVFGCWWRARITQWADGVRWWTGALIVAAWLVATGILGVLGWGDVPVLGFGLRVLGVAAGVVLAVWLSPVRILRGLGRETLPIYMVHSLLLLAGVTALVAIGAGGWPGVGWWLPPALALTVLSASWAIGRIAPRVGAAWLFTTPRWLARFFESSHNGSQPVISAKSTWPYHRDRGSRGERLTSSSPLGFLWGSRTGHTRKRTGHDSP